MADLRVEQKQALSRQDAARFVAELATGLADDGRVTVRLGDSTLELSVADRLRCELEVTVDGDSIELELELKWSTSAGASGQETEESAEGGPGEPEEPSEDEEPDEDDFAPGPAAAARAEEGESDTDPGGAAEADAEQAASSTRSTEQARGRRRASTPADKPAFNDVDTAAVRAWAAANGLTVSPRGRIREEVLKAYRAAGN